MFVLLLFSFPSPFSITFRFEHLSDDSYRNAFWSFDRIPTECISVRYQMSITVITPTSFLSTHIHYYRYSFCICWFSNSLFLWSIIPKQISFLMLFWLSYCIIWFYIQKKRKKHKFKIKVWLVLHFVTLRYITLRSILFCCVVLYLRAFS